VKANKVEGKAKKEVIRKKERRTEEDWAGGCDCFDARSFCNSGSNGARIESLTPSEIF